MKKLSLILVCMLVLSFSIIGCKQSIDSKKFQEKVAASAGYLIASKHPERAPEMLKWYSEFMVTTDEFLQSKYQEGIAKLIASVTDDPFLAFEIQSAMDLLGISIEGPGVPEEIDQYRYIVDAFMTGVAAAPQIV